MQKITTFLWFDTQAEEAVNFYTALFTDSKINNELRGGSRLRSPVGGKPHVRDMRFFLRHCAAKLLNT